MIEEAGSSPPWATPEDERKRGRPVAGPASLGGVSDDADDDDDDGVISREDGTSSGNGNGGGGGCENFDHDLTGRARRTSSPVPIPRPPSPPPSGPDPEPVVWRATNGDPAAAGGDDSGYGHATSSFLFPPSRHAYAAGDVPMGRDEGFSCSSSSSGEGGGFVAAAVVGDGRGGGGGGGRIRTGGGRPRGGGASGGASGFAVADEAATDVDAGCDDGGVGGEFFSPSYDGPDGWSCPPNNPAGVAVDDDDPLRIGIPLASTRSSSAVTKPHRLSSSSSFDDSLLDQGTSAPPSSLSALRPPSLRRNYSAPVSASSSATATASTALARFATERPSSSSLPSSRRSSLSSRTVLVVANRPVAMLGGEAEGGTLVPPVEIEGGPSHGTTHHVAAAVSSLKRARSDFSLGYGGGDRGTSPPTSSAGNGEAVDAASPSSSGIYPTLDLGPLPPMMAKAGRLDRSRSDGRLPPADAVGGSISTPPAPPPHSMAREHSLYPTQEEFDVDGGGGGRDHERYVEGDDEDAGGDGPSSSSPGGGENRSFYYEVTLHAGKAWVGLVGADAVTTNSTGWDVMDGAGSSSSTAETARWHHRQWRDRRGDPGLEHRFPVLLDLFPGKCPNSVGLESDGHLYVNGARIGRYGEALHGNNAVDDIAEAWGSNIGVGDTVGCGWDADTLIVDEGAVAVYFTLNGELLYPENRIRFPFGGGTGTGTGEIRMRRSQMVFPAVGLTSDSVIGGNFGRDPAKPFLKRGYTRAGSTASSRVRIRPRSSNDLGGGGTTSNGSAPSLYRNEIRIEKQNEVDYSNGTFRHGEENDTKMSRTEDSREAVGGQEEEGRKERASLDEDLLTAIEEVMQSSTPARPQRSGSGPEEDAELLKAINESLRSKRLHDDHRQNLSISSKGAAKVESITKEDIEDFKDCARDLRRIVSDPTSQPEIINSFCDVCRDKQELVQAVLPKMEEGEIFEKLLMVNDILSDALEEATKKVPPEKEGSQDHPPTSISPPSFSGDAKKEIKEKAGVDALVAKKDVFNLICLLRSEARLEAAKAIMLLAKSEDEVAADGVTKLRDEIMSSGGMHSLLNLFKSCGSDDAELVHVTALGVSYLVPSSRTDTSHCKSNFELKLLDCIRYLVNSSNQEDRKTAALALTHRWINVLQPLFINMTGIIGRDEKHKLQSPAGLKGECAVNLPCRRQSQLRRRGRRLDERRDSIEMQELLEKAVALVITVADFEVPSVVEARSDPLRQNATVAVESMCAVEQLRTVAVREGLISVLVRWLTSNDAELVHCAANSLRDLTSPYDEYMAGWIHSQIVNESAIPAIVKLAVSNQSSVRLAIAQILSSLAVAPHARTAIIEANGLSYIIQLLNDAVQDVTNQVWDAPLALAAGSALLRLASGTTNHATGWARQRMDRRVPLGVEGHDIVPSEVVERGALEPLVSMASSKEREKVRMVSVELLRIISDDVRPDRWTRQKLCEAGAAKAFGAVLRQDSSTLNLHPAVGSKEEVFQECTNALHGLANMLEPTSNDEEEVINLAIEFGSPEGSTTQAVQASLESICQQVAESGGVKSLLSIASIPLTPQADVSFSVTDDSLDWNGLFLESYRCLASLCPLLLSPYAAKKKIAAFAKDILVTLTGVLKQSRWTELDGGIVQELQLDSLVGLCSLATYEPLRAMIMTDHEALTQLIQFKNVRKDVNELAQAANQVFLAMGFSPQDMELAGNDPKLLADWFSVELSLLMQAMARDEIRVALYHAWKHCLENQPDPGSTGVGPLGSDRSITESNSRVDRQRLLGRLFHNLSDDSSGNCDRRDKILREYRSIYDDCIGACNDCNGRRPATSERADDVDATLQTLQGDRSAANDSRTDEEAIALCPVCEDSNADAEKKSNKAYAAQYKWQKLWIMGHQRAAKLNEDSAKCREPGILEPTTDSSIPLPVRVRELLDFHFPSPLLQDEILPIADFRPEASFDFRALSMPERRYFSFRREGQVLSRICDKWAAVSAPDDIHWSLSFTNSSFAGEFGESLVQTLYRCPSIQSISFSRRSSHEDDIASSEREEDDGSTLLAFLAGSLPPWVTWLTFDNVLNKGSLSSLINILETMGHRTTCNGNKGGKLDGNDIPDFAGGSGPMSQAGCTQASIQALAIRNQRMIRWIDLDPFFGLLGIGAFLSLRLLDLSGNRMGDEKCAAVLEVAYKKNSRSLLERLDLSGNNIQVGSHVIGVLSSYTKSRRRQQDSSSSYKQSSSPSWSSRLKTLNLGSNNLEYGTVVEEIASMLENDSLNLSALGLADNNITGNEGSLYQVFPHALAHNTRLIKLDLSKNRLQQEFLDSFLLRIGAAGSKSKLAFICTDDNDPALSSDQIGDLHRVMVHARSEWVDDYFQTRHSQSSYERNHIDGGNIFDSGFGKQGERLQAHDDNLATKEQPTYHSDGSDTGLPPPSLLRSKSDSATWSLSTDVSMSPSASSKPRRRESLGGNKITVLFSSPLVFRDHDETYKPIDLLDIELERELLWKCFKEASMDIELAFDTATTDRLQAVMTKCCGCLHYSGHGHPKYLTFEDGQGGLRWLSVDELKNLIGNGVKGGGAPFNFVFVSACHSRLAGETFINAGVPHVVCCQQESQIMDSAALAFTRAFYLALAIGRTVKDSFEIGRQAVAVSPTVPNSVEEMRKFVLLPDNGNHNVPIFDADHLPSWPRNAATNSFGLFVGRGEGQASFPEQPLPSPPQGFIGRETEMYSVLNAILARRFVSVVGMSGIGRSSLASSICHYINDRKSTMIAVEVIFYVDPQHTRGRDQMGFIAPFYKQLVSAGLAQPLQKSADFDVMCENIFLALSKTKALIVFDGAEVLEGSDEENELPLFLSSLFRKTRHVRVLMTARKELGLTSLGGEGEYVFKLGPLDLRSTVRLFGILCPHVHTGHERTRLLKCLVPENQANAKINSKDITEYSKMVLSRLGDGIPARTFDVAYRISKDDFDELLQAGHSKSAKST